MLIGVNQNHEIEQINTITDEMLTVYDVDRNRTFRNMSDFMILHYCYDQDDGSVGIYPRIDPIKIESLEKDNEILNLQAQVIELEYQKRLQEVM